MITVEHLSKFYGDVRAVDDITFTCRPGAVTGFLGPNGAGKTTTMRVIAGLTSATSGDATVAGVHYHDVPNPGTQVGVLLDASAQHAGRTGREILAISAATMGLPTSRIDEMLDLVSLTPTEAKRRVRNYSLGMRQRLGIANALLGDPKILVLDEPANGLDPAGIHWMRSLLRSYADRGGTVLALLPPVARDRGHRRRDHRHRRRPDRRPGHEGRAAAERRHLRPRRRSVGTRPGTDVGRHHLDAGR